MWQSFVCELLNGRASRLAHPDKRWKIRGRSPIRGQGPRRVAGGESTAAWALDQERSPRGADPCITGVQEAWRQASRVQQVAVTGSGRPDCSLPHHRIEMAGSDASSDGFDRSPLHGESGGGGEGEEAPAPAPHAEGGGDTGGGEWASAEGSAQVPQAGVEAGAEGAEQKEAPAPAGGATAGSAGGADAKVFIGGLTGDTTEMHLRDHFQPYGDITDAVVMRDKMTQKSRGFGFVTFASADSVERVLADKVCWSLYGVSRYVCAIACARAFLRVCVCTCTCVLTLGHDRSHRASTTLLGATWTSRARCHGMQCQPRHGAMARRRRRTSGRSRKSSWVASTARPATKISRSILPSTGPLLRPVS